jgi:hypothetical protein
MKTLVSQLVAWGLVAAFASSAAMVALPCMLLNPTQYDVTAWTATLSMLLGAILLWTYTWCIFKSSRG